MMVKMVRITLLFAAMTAVSACNNRSRLTGAEDGAAPLNNQMSSQGR
jgi:hypothetical protein